MPEVKTLLTAATLTAVLLIGQGCGISTLAKKPGAKKNATAARELAITKSPRFLAGIQAYKKNDYKDAIGNFEYVDAHGGCCQWTHYYLGLCYQGENQLGLAFRHYEWVIGHAKDRNLRRYSQFGCDTVTYYAANRTYAGQGGIMGAVAYSKSGGGGGGGGGSFG